MKRMKQLGWIMGASLLTIGGGVTASLTTTSCSNKLGLTFDLKAIQMSLSNDDPATIITYLIKGTVDGLKENESCVLVTTTNGKEPKDNTNIWNPILDYTKKGLLAGNSDENGNSTEVQGAMSYESKSVGDKITFDNVYGARATSKAEHEDWYKIKVTLIVIAPELTI